jgi:AbrB family looped-hinge helix DNA binding protein
MSLATVTSKGQVTLPKALRDALGIKPGSEVGFRALSEDRAELQVVATHPLANAGILQRPGQRSLTVEDMDASFARAVAEKHRRRRR